MEEHRYAGYEPDVVGNRKKVWDLTGFFPSRFMERFLEALSHQPGFEPYKPVDAPVHFRNTRRGTHGYCTYDKLVAKGWLLGKRGWKADRRRAMVRMPAGYCVIKANLKGHVTAFEMHSCRDRDEVLGVLLARALECAERLLTVVAHEVAHVVDHNTGATAGRWKPGTHWANRGCEQWAEGLVHEVFGRSASRKFWGSEEWNAPAVLTKFRDELALLLVDAWMKKFGDNFSCLQQAAAKPE